MKALKSSLAKELLADPEARKHLRRYLAHVPSGAHEAAQSPDVIIELQSHHQGRSGPLRVVPQVVPRPG